MGRPSILRTLLKILTPDEIDDLSRIYLTLYRKSLTRLMDTRLNQEKVEMGFGTSDLPPPISKIKPLMPKIKEVKPPILGKEEVIGGASFYLEEKEKFKGISSKQKKLSSTYGKTTKLEEKISRGLLINKKCA